MRTIIILSGAGLLLASLLGTARILHLSSALASVAFLFLWLAISTFNMWFGVEKAGYTLAEEWSVFMIIFGLPATATVLFQWKLTGTT